MIHPALAPYRVDLFNRALERLELEILFLRGQVSYHRDLDQAHLASALSVPADRLRGNAVILNRDVPWGLGQAVRAFRPEVVVTSEFSLPSLVAHRLKRRHRFGHVIWSDENPVTFAAHGLVRERLRRFCSRRADALMMCSGEVRDLFVDRYAIEPRRVFKCAVHQAPESLRRLLAAAAEPARRMVAEEAMQARRVVLFVGRLAPVKNLGLALRAFAQAFRGEPGTVLVLVGTGECADELQRESQRLGIREQVRFAGHRQGVDLFAWYRVASLLILPSTYEPYGAVVNEALVCGVPVVCSTRAGAVRLVRDGVNGTRFDPEDANALVDALRRAAPDFRCAGDWAERERPDLMPVPFERDVDGFVGAVECAAERCRAS